MLTYLQKYNGLPGALRDKISTPEVMAEVGAMEKKYGVHLATLIMRVMVKDIAVSDLDEYFNFEYDLDRPRAEALARELREKIFSRAAGYLSVAPETERTGPVPPAAGRPAIVSPKPAPAEANKPGGREGLDRWLASKKKDTSARPPDFYFSAEDEEEIKQLAGRVRDFTGSEAPEPAYGKETADKIMKELDIRFFSGELDSRFSAILESYWRGIRKRLDAKEAMMKPRDRGGLDLKESLADEVLNRLEGVKKDAAKEAVFAPPKKIEVPEDAAAAGAPGTRDVGYDFSKLPRKETPEEKTPEKEAPADDRPQEEKPEESREAEAETEERAAPEAKYTINLREAKEEAPAEEKEEDDKTGPGEEESSVFNMADSRRIAGLYNKPAPSGKVKIEDVKYVPKLTGPIDELREMGLVDFRRLHDSPSLAAEKIKEKIGFLEEENYGKRLLGIRAWRQSPVNKIYLAIGQKSMAEQKPISAVISDYRESGEECLSRAEFMAVMELNKSLRF